MIDPNFDPYERLIYAFEQTIAQQTTIDQLIDSHNAFSDILVDASVQHKRLVDLCVRNEREIKNLKQSQTILEARIKQLETK